MNLSSQPGRMERRRDQSRESLCFHEVLEDVPSHLTRLVSREARDHPGTVIHIKVQPSDGMARLYYHYPDWTALNTQHTIVSRRIAIWEKY